MSTHVGLGAGRGLLMHHPPEYSSVVPDPTACSDIKALEHPTLKVPYEILNKKFRSAQKIIDREISHVQSSVSELEKFMSSGGMSNLTSFRSLPAVGASHANLTEESPTRSEQTPDSDSDMSPPRLQSPAPPTSGATVGAINELLNGVVERLNVLKRKSQEAITDELEAANVCKRRLDHLREYCFNQSNEVSVNQWKKKRLDRMLVEHFLRSGFYDTAIKLALSSNIEQFTNIDLFLVSRQVEESLARHETAKCLNWCYDNKSKLRKIKSSLEFNLRQQEFIELVRHKRRMEAIVYSRKYFNSLEDTKQQRDLEHCMGLLAFGRDTHIEPYKSLFDGSRWNSLALQFRQDNFKLFQLSSTSVFSTTLQAGLSALKTPQCYTGNGGNKATKSSECPVCSDLLNQLSKSLPCAHCSQSRLVCYISGQSLNEHNQPLILPNGYVYGEMSLKKMAAENNGKIICPRTKAVFDFKQTEKVYVM